MAVRFLFFAQSADWMKTRELSASVSGPSGLLDLIKGMPEFAPILKNRAHLKVAVNCEYAAFNAEVQDGDEVAFLPPVSGG